MSSIMMKGLSCWVFEAKGRGFENCGTKRLKWSIRKKKRRSVTHVSIIILQACCIYRFETTPRKTISSQFSGRAADRRLTPHLPAHLDPQPKRIALPTPRPLSGPQEIETDRLQDQPLDLLNLLLLLLQLFLIHRTGIQLSSALEQIRVSEGVGS
jgi:hypothetical protein